MTSSCYVTSPCQRRGCSVCCFETAMTLTDADVQRITRAGHGGFSISGDRGSLTLRNIGGHCVFLTESGCSIYPIRPEGCTLYPLVLETTRNVVILDDVCPYRDEFSFSAADRRRLLASIASEEADARRRRSTARTQS